MDTKDKREAKYVDGVCVCDARPAGVVIGRNEGERLRVCLASLIGVIGGGVEWVVYVDSGSTDGSVEMAEAMGVEVVCLDMSIPFTAARARNAGVERLRELGSDVEYIQFVDGDCEMRAEWFAQAIKVFVDNDDAVIVCGRLRERYRERSIYNRLCDIEWNREAGEVESCGGIFMIRRDAFVAVGGFDDEIIAGEEPELCVRLRGRGGKVIRIAAEMALHDADMTRFGQWWRRSVRSGHGYAEAMALHGGSAWRKNMSIAF